MKLELAKVQKDVARYLELLTMYRDLMHVKNSKLNKEKSQGGKLYDLKYNERKNTLDGKSFSWIDRFGTPEQQTKLWERYRKMENSFVKEEWKLLKKYDKEMTQIHDKYYFLYQNVYIGWPDSSDHEAFLQVILKVVENQELTDRKNTHVRWNNTKKRVEKVWSRYRGQEPLRPFSPLETFQDVNDAFQDVYEIMKALEITGQAMSDATYELAVAIQDREIGKVQ